MRYTRMPIEIESPEQMGYDTIKNNLTESSYTDKLLNLSSVKLDEILLCYGDHRGHEKLRELLAAESPLLTKDDVLLTVGASAALFMIATSLLEADDELIVVRPNYATNIETPRAIGATIHFIDLSFEEGFAIDFDILKSKINARTKLISVTHPHNPTGVCLSDDDLKTLAEIAETNNCFVLVDETYRDLAHSKLLPLAATYSDKIISVSSCSKSYGLPGIRLGWLICHHAEFMETMLAAKEQIHITGSVMDEEVGYRFLLQKQTVFPAIQEDIRVKFQITKDWMENQHDFEWVKPDGGVVCFPRIINADAVDIDKFYSILNSKYGTYVGPGHWFEMPRHYMRIGYAWPTVEELKDGLAALSHSVAEAKVT
jgi:aspartate/methionine/tyrosine aminotransferase